MRTSVYTKYEKYRPSRKAAKLGAGHKIMILRSFRNGSTPCPFRLYARACNLLYFHFKYMLTYNLNMCSRTFSLNSVLRRCTALFCSQAGPKEPFHSSLTLSLKSHCVSQSTAASHSILFSQSVNQGQFSFSCSLSKLD